MNIKKTVSSICLLILLVIASAQTGFEFVQQDIAEIVYAVSLSRKFPIICDDTVSGSATFRFSGGDFNSAFDSFLLSNRLYSYKEPDKWIVTKVLVLVNEDGLVQIDANDVPASVIFEKISRFCVLPVVHEELPSVPLSIHVANTDVCGAVTVIMKSFPNYTVTEDKSYIYVKKQVSPDEITNYNGFHYGTNNIDSEVICEITSEDDLFTVNIANSNFLSVIEELSKLAGIEFCSFVNKDLLIGRVTFTGKPFSEALSLICGQVDAVWSKKNGVYSFYTEANARAKLLEPDRTWKTFHLKYKQAQEVASSMVVRFPQLSPHIAGVSDILCNVSPLEELEIYEYLKVFDSVPERYLIELKYIRTEDFLLHLPKYLNNTQFSDAGNRNTVFFNGSAEAYVQLEKDLKFIDRPAMRIAYDLLVISAQKSITSSWKTSFNAETLKPGLFPGVSGSISSSLSLNFDLITTFGVVFSEKLKAAVAESKAEICADTTLHGVSGKLIKFQNTNTFRYRDPSIETNNASTVTTGVTREIVSGLVIDITGWVSGDGMITTSVTASVSRRGIDVSSNTGNPPPTTEKVVTTEVRGRSGEVIVLSGLQQDDTSLTEERTPGLGKIPLLGWLFKANDNSNDKTEMIIYLVPHLDITEEQRGKL